MHIPRMLFFILSFSQIMLFAEEWNTVNLASFPRSGNHWVRFLVEEATHITTSSVYSDGDYPHLQKPFPWGGFSPEHGYEGHCRYPTTNDPVLLKTHYPVFPKRITPDPQRTICLIRHPIDSFWSFYVYQNKKSSEKITSMDKKKLSFFIEKWRQFYEFWQEQPNVLFVRYEDLHVNTELYLSNILQAAGYSFDQTDVERAVARYSPIGTPLKHLHRYDEESIEMIKTELADILTRFNYDTL